MAYVDCPRCHKRLGLPDYVLDRVNVRCPFCEQYFQDEPKKRRREVNPPRAHRGEPSRPQLTSPHPCHQCHRDLTSPTGHRRCTVICPACQLPTSVYAVIHYCLNCGALLESPSRRQGTEAPCPVCARSLTVPQDFLFHDREEAADETTFGFPCPHCRRALQTSPRHAGETAVCPHCLRPSVVPPCGYLVEVRGRSPTAGTTRPCGFCELEIPTRAPFCPHCGKENAT